MHATWRWDHLCMLHEGGIICACYMKVGSSVHATWRWDHLCMLHEGGTIHACYMKVGSSVHATWRWDHLWEVHGGGTIHWPYMDLFSLRIVSTLFPSSVNLPDLLTVFGHSRCQYSHLIVHSSRLLQWRPRNWTRASGTWTAWGWARVWEQWNSVGFGCVTYEHPVPNGKKLRHRERKRGGMGGWISCLRVKSFLPACWEKNNTGTCFHIRRVGLRSLGGFWHTWKFDTKSHLHYCCPEPFNHNGLLCG